MTSVHQEKRDTLRLDGIQILITVIVMLFSFLSEGIDIVYSESNDPISKISEGDFAVSKIDGSIMVNIGNGLLLDVFPVRNYQINLCSNAGICDTSSESSDPYAAAILDEKNKEAYCVWTGRRLVTVEEIGKAVAFAGYNGILFSDEFDGFRCAVDSREINSLDYRFPTQTEIESFLMYEKLNDTSEHFDSIDQAIDNGLSLIRIKDNMEEVFIPSCHFIMGSDATGAKADEKPVHDVYLSPYLIDKTEVTNKQYALCVESGTCSEPVSKAAYSVYSYYGNAEYDEYPVVSITWKQAQDYCEWVGMRLPTEAEWELAAKGVDGLIYPWGNEYVSGYTHDVSVNVLYPEKSGMRENDRSPYGALEMGGNVSEWTNDNYSDSWYRISGMKNPLGPLTGYYKVIRGGSYLYQSTYSRTTNRNYAAENVNSGDRGFRCADSLDIISMSNFSLSNEILEVSVPDYTERIAELVTLSRNDETNDEIDDGEDVIDLKSNVISIPGGTFQMGFSGGKADEMPVHSVTVSDFYMDQYEVTNASYAECVHAGYCTEPQSIASLIHMDYYSNEEYASYPVVNITWAQAEAYCENQGGRLPTEAEWEYAASGGTGNVYPWGNVFDPTNLNYAGSGNNDPVAVGTVEGDVSLFGISDMGGNVSEWVWDNYSDTWYSQSLNRTDPKGPESGIFHSVRGTSFQRSEFFARTSYRFYAKGDAISFDRGFRCVYEK